MSINVRLDADPAQASRLAQLQAVFAAACNALVPFVREHRCWHRVTLHHLAYHALREQFPQLGSQMACNAIYSVSRVCRILFRHPASPWNLSRLGDGPLPMLKFAPTAPVYFDRHTLSLRPDGLSLFTLDGRMHFSLSLAPAIVERFSREKLREIVLSSQRNAYWLTFHFGSAVDGLRPDELPEYVMVYETGQVRQVEGGTKEVVSWR